MNRLTIIACAGLLISSGVNDFTQVIEVVNALFGE